MKTSICFFSLLWSVFLHNLLLSLLLLLLLVLLWNTSAKNWVLHSLRFGGYLIIRTWESLFLLHIILNLPFYLWPPLLFSAPHIPSLQYAWCSSVLDRDAILFIPFPFNTVIHYGVHSFHQLHTTPDSPPNTFDLSLPFTISTSVSSIPGMVDHHIHLLHTGTHLTSPHVVRPQEYSLHFLLSVIKSRL